jgi:hypothetical protein
MKKPDSLTLKQIAAVSKSYPAVLTWLRDAYTEELERLPMVTTNTALAQGRCIVLRELVDQFSKAPDQFGDLETRASTNANR